MPKALVLLALAGQLAVTQYAVGQVAGRRFPISRPPAVPPDIPAASSRPDFPLRVHLFLARWGGAGYVYHGFGSGNVVDGAAPQGFDFTFDCSVPFVENGDAAEFYQARWKKPSFRLEILMGKVGSKHLDTCELDVALRPQPFNPTLAAMLPYGSPLLPSPVWQAPDMVFSEPAPDYPVQLHVLSSLRTEDQSGAQGYGTANLLGNPVRGVDFNYRCRRGFLANLEITDAYQGRWLKPDRRLEILTRRTGSDQVDRCQLEVTLKNQPYASLRSAGSVQPASTAP